MTRRQILVNTALVFPWGLRCQQVDSPPAFEAASVRPSREQGLGFIPSPGKITVRSYTLKELIAVAYRVKDYQVSGGPRWITMGRYDIVATAGRRATTLEMLPMLATLLRERFSLTFHRETRRLRGYALVVARGGPKLAVPSPEDPTKSGVNLSAGHLQGYKLPMEQFALVLGSQLHVPLVDKTGLKGRFDIRLDWASNGLQPAPAPSASDSVANERPSIFAALQEQLGLRLQVENMPVELIVVDTAEKPSEN